MIFWKVDKLVTQLKYDTLSENQKAFYLVGFCLLMLPNLVIKIQDLYHLEYSFLIELSVAVLITLIGIQACFRVNESGDNSRFIERFICLAFPIYFRLIIYAFIWQYFQSVILRFIDAFFILEHRFYLVEDGINLLASVVINTLFFIWIKRHLSSVAQVSKHTKKDRRFRADPVGVC